MQSKQEVIELSVFLVKHFITESELSLKCVSIDAITAQKMWNIAIDSN